MKKIQILSSVPYNEENITAYSFSILQNHIVNITNSLKTVFFKLIDKNLAYFYVQNPNTGEYALFCSYLSTIILCMKWVENKLFLISWNTKLLRVSILENKDNFLEEVNFKEFSNINIMSFIADNDKGVGYFVNGDFIIKVHPKNLSGEKFYYIGQKDYFFVQNSVIFEYQKDKNICNLSYIDMNTDTIISITAINNTGIDFNSIENIIIDGKVVFNILEQKLYILKIV